MLNRSILICPLKSQFYKQRLLTFHESCTATSYIRSTDTRSSIMKRTRRAITLCCSVFLAAYLGINGVRAQEQFRVRRPISGDAVQPAANPDFGANPDSETNSASTRAPLQANAIMNQDFMNSAQPTQSFYSNVMQWETKNNPNFQSMNGTAGSAHHGLKAHLGNALFAMAQVAGTVATSYAPMTVSRHPHVPTLKVDAGHCPAMVDPAFQFPVRWWDDLAREQSDPNLGPQWNLWLKAVQDVFESRAYELRDTPGSAALHVIINPNGTIFNMSPYTGPERSYSNRPTSERTLLQLRDMVGTVGMFPPFPAGTRVRCYHLIFDGSSGN
jgi:hypothetical protein